MKRKEAQVAAKQAQEKMILFLLQFSPAGDLRIKDAQTIADFAQGQCFDAIEQFLED